MINEEKMKLLNRVLKGNIENEEEQKIYLDYLKEQLDEISFSYKKEKYDNIKTLFAKSIDEHKDLYDKSLGLGLFFWLIFIFTLIAMLIEGILNIDFSGLTKDSLFNTTCFKILLFEIPIPSLISFVKAFIKDYIPREMKTKHNYKMKKQELIKEYENTLNLSFIKSKEIDSKTDNNLNIENRYLFSEKDKILIYERIANLTNQIKLINDNDIIIKYALEATAILQSFNEARIHFENIDSNKTQLFLQDKITIETEISNKLYELEQKVMNCINKENRMLNDDEKVKTLQKKLTVLSAK